jgi:hypothetical protein
MRMGFGCWLQARSHARCYRYGATLFAEVVYLLDGIGEEADQGLSDELGS